MVVSALAAEDGNEVLSLSTILEESCVGRKRLLRDHDSCWCGPNGFYNAPVAAGTCLETLTVDIGFRFRYDKNVTSPDEDGQPRFKEKVLDLSFQVLLIIAIKVFRCPPHGHYMDIWPAVAVGVVFSKLGCGTNVVRMGVRPTVYMHAGTLFSPFQVGGSFCRKTPRLDELKEICFSQIEGR